MKSSEFIRTDEGVMNWVDNKLPTVGNWLSQKGVRGKEKQIAAVGAQMQREKQALGNAIRTENYNKFVKDLPIAIQNAIRSGLVNSSTVPGPTTGGMNISTFVKKYVKTLFSNFTLPQSLELPLDFAVEQFERSYDPRKSTLSGPALESADKIWNVYETASKISTTVRDGNYPFPTAGEEVITAKGKYEFDGTKWHMTEKVTSPPGARFPTLSPVIPPGEILDRAKILELNRLAVST